MGIFEKIKKHLDKKSDEKELKLLFDPLSMYEQDKVDNDDFFFRVASYFSDLYNDLYYSDFDETMHDKYQEYLTKLTNNFAEASEYAEQELLGIRSRAKTYFEKKFGINLEHELYEKDSGIAYTQLWFNGIGHDHEGVFTMEDCAWIDADLKSLEQSVSLLGAIVSAVGNCGLNQNCMPFIKGDVLAIDLQSFNDYESEIEQFVENIELPQNPTDDDMYKARDVFQWFAGEPFDLKLFENMKYMERAKGETDDKYEKRIFRELHCMYETYLDCLHGLDPYKSVTVYDQMIIKNDDFLECMVDPIIKYVPAEIDSLYNLLDENQSKVTIDEKLAKHYATVFDAVGFEAEDIKEHFQVIDVNDYTRPMELDQIREPKQQHTVDNTKKDNVR